MLRIFSCNVVLAMMNACYQQQGHFVALSTYNTNSVSGIDLIVYCLLFIELISQANGDIAVTYFFQTEQVLIIMKEKNVKLGWH